MAFRIGLLKSSALQNDGLDGPVMLQCPTPQETNPKGHWGPNYFLRNSPFNGDVDLLAAPCILQNIGTRVPQSGEAYSDMPR